MDHCKHTIQFRIGSYYVGFEGRTRNIYRTYNELTDEEKQIADQRVPEKYACSIECHDRKENK